MGQVRIPDVSSLEWVTPRDFDAPREGIDIQPDEIVAVDESAPATAARFLHPGSVSELQLLEVRVPAGMDIDVHAHASDEIIYVLTGELHFGARVLGPGASVYIPGWTLYGFRAGDDEELRFLNFRASLDVSYLTKAELLARRGSGAPPTDPAQTPE
jgi:mannose-6-phosphate isomerase-like protein (cupin superfamily)